MTTIRGRIYHQTADITPIDHDPTKHELTSIGWTADILINGSTFASRPGLPTHQTAWAACEDMINAILGSPFIQLLHQLEDDDFATQLARTSALSAAWKFHPLRHFKP